jgi:hypothetical protein
LRIGSIEAGHATTGQLACSLNTQRAELYHDLHMLASWPIMHLPGSRQEKKERLLERKASAVPQSQVPEQVVQEDCFSCWDLGSLDVRPLGRNPNQADLWFE